MTFLSAAVLLNLSPGSDIAFILGNTVKGGTRAGFAAILGIWTGALVHVLLAVIGVSAILATSEVAFTIVKWAGVVYLVWLGVQMIRSSGGAFVTDDVQAKQTFWPIFRQGVLIDLLNPKVAIFFLAFLPQFVVPGAGSVPSQLLLHGVLIIAVAAVIEPPLVMVGGRFTERLRNSPQIAKWLDRALGALLIALAGRLMTLQR
ncbi:LysE family translocator [Pseudahrensia aquimaris]|uniref:LysE family translocator n=1 Tax=Pseudahrensia aquimaris TaxID=744461 RepID=A0ABW3FIB8_9HYPH